MLKLKGHSIAFFLILHNHPGIICSQRAMKELLDYVETALSIDLAILFTYLWTV